MPSVRVRRNTAPVSALAPAERLPVLSTEIRANSGNQDATRQDRQENLVGKGDSRQDQVVLGSLVAADKPKGIGDAGQVSSPVRSPRDNDTPINPNFREAASDPRESLARRASGTASASTARRRPRSRTIQAIFPPTEEFLRGSRLPGLSEEPVPPERNTRPSMESRLSADERTHRAEMIARARGESFTSTSGAASVSIRLPARDRSQVEEAVNSESVVEAPQGHRRRSASITLSLAAKARRSNDRARLSGDKPRSDSVSSTTGPATTRARARTVGTPGAGIGRGRADSVGLMSYFGLGNGMEEKLQSREDERRDLEKGLRAGEYGADRTLSTTEEAREEEEAEHHEDEVVEHLDVIDPEISAVSHLQNFANSVVIPYLPQLYSRKPVLDLPGTSEKPTDDQANTGPSSGLRSRKPTVSQPARALDAKTPASDKSRPSADDQVSTVFESSEEDALDQHVKDVLKKSKKEWLKRSLKGVWAFLKTPMGIIVGIYGFLVVFWGAALVIFLLGWIPLSSDNLKDIWVERCSQIENGLFTVTGVGLIPWRVMDAYRIIRIWQLKRLSIRLRKERGLPPIEDPDDLPDPKLDPDFVPVLSEYQQALLEYQQERFMASQTWYRPHATETHRAFSINWALWICLLVVGNSVFQCMLCGCMWGLNRHQRPAWTTGSLIPLSFGCGIASGILIWKGGQRTKKTAQVEKKLRKALGMGSHEGSIDDKEKTTPTPPPKTEIVGSDEFYHNGDAGGGSSEPSEYRDSQRLLPDPMSPATTVALGTQNNVRTADSGEEYEVREQRS